MTKIGQIEIADGMPQLEIKRGESTIQDYKGNESVFYWFQDLKALAKNWDKAKAIELAEEIKRKD